MHREFSALGSCCWTFRKSWSLRGQTAAAPGAMPPGGLAYMVAYTRVIFISGCHAFLTKNISGCVLRGTDVTHWKALTCSPGTVSEVGERSQHETKNEMESPDFTQMEFVVLPPTPLQVCVCLGDRQAADSVALRLRDGTAPPACEVPSSAFLSEGF